MCYVPCVLCCMCVMLHVCHVPYVLCSICVMLHVCYVACVMFHVCHVPCVLFHMCYGLDMFIFELDSKLFLNLFFKNIVLAS